MAGPASPLLDDFNRADENPLSDGGSWINKLLTTDVNLKLVSNQVLATSAARCGAYWAAAADSEAFLTVATLPTSDGVGLWLRVIHPGTANVSGYMAWYEPSAPSLAIWRVTNGAFTRIAIQTSPAFATGDKLWFRASGSSLVLATFHGGVWADQLTVTDTTYAGGYIGIFGGANTTWRVDDFGGGAVPTSGPRGAVLDDFNRADENPLSDAGAWTNKVVSTDGNLKLVSNKVAATSAARDGASWNAETFIDSEAFLTISTLPTSDGAGLWLRVTNPGISSATGYMAWWSPGNGVRIWRLSSGGTLTALTPYADPDLAAGDKLWFRAVGTRLTLAVFHNGVWGNWLTVTDATYGSGYIGIFGGANTTWRVDDFGGGPDFFLPFITSVTVVYALTTPGTVAVPFIASVAAVFAPTVEHREVDVPFIASATVVYALTVQEDIDAPFIASVTIAYAPALFRTEVDVPFIASKTRVFGVFSLFEDFTRTGVPGNGGEGFPVILAPNGSSVTATLDVSITAATTLLDLTGDSGLPDGGFVVQIDDEVLYIVKITAGSYRIRKRGASNTTPDAHTAGADVTWGDSYEMPVTAGNDIAHEFTANIESTGSLTYPGWLICFDSTQAYLGADRYPMHVTSVLGVFHAGAGSTGSNRCDAAQPNAVCTPIGVRDDCPAALSNPSRIATNILAGDVAVVRYTNPEASELELGPRSAALQSWFGLKRVSTGGADVTFTDPNGIVVDTTGTYDTFTGSINGEWVNPLGPGIGPDTGLPTSHDVPYTSVTLPGADRNFTVAVEKGWPICALAVRQGTRRVPFWRSWDWRNYSFVYTGFGVDDTYVQMLINRNGIVFVSVPEVELPGPQDIDGPDAVWDDGSYYFGASWYVAMFNGPYFVGGPPIGGTPLDITGGPVTYVPTVDFGVGGTFTPSVTVPPDVSVEGGSGGGINPPNLGQRFDAALV